MKTKMRLSVLGFGLAWGVSFGVYALFIGITAWLWGWGTGIVEVVSSLYIGFAPTFLGSIIGMLWAFGDGFIGGVIIAWVYNLVVRQYKAKKEDVTSAFTE